jgi:hypothetical protein
MISGINIKNGKSYIFSFRARSTEEFKIPAIKLMQVTSPWSEYSSYHTDYSAIVDTQWHTYNILYDSDRNDDNAAITAFLGVNFKSGMKLYIDSIAFSEVDNSDIRYDIGNVILDSGQVCGVKVFKKEDLSKQNDFYYDKKNKTIELYSLDNPASLYKYIELALDKHIVDVNYKSYVIIKNLNFKYGGACGIFGNNTHHIKLLNCDISFIGGALLHFKDNSPIRYGNGVNFMNQAHDNLVQGCNIWEIYDSAMTNQVDTDGIAQYNISYNKNYIRNAEWSFEYWNSSKDGVTHDIYFTNNICRDAGVGWGHSQRPDPSGIHICLPDNTALTKNIVIENNVFDYSASCTVLIGKVWNGLKDLILRNNQYTVPKNHVLVSWRLSKVFFACEFDKYRQETGKDTKSIIMYQHPE